MGVAPATWQFAELLLVCEAAGVKADQAEPEFAASIGELHAVAFQTTRRLASAILIWPQDDVQEVGVWRELW
jgi:hypothetical protein